MPKEGFPRNWHQPFQDKDWNSLETAKTVIHEKTQKEKNQEKIKHNIVSVSGLFLEEPMLNIFICFEFNIFACLLKKYFLWSELIIN